jgi:hypothetical protein
MFASSSVRIEAAAWLTAQPWPEKATSAIRSPLTRMSMRISSPQTRPASSWL